MAGYRSLNESTVNGVACTSRAPLLYRGCRRCPATFASLLRDFPQGFQPLSRKPTIAVLATARLMARITWQLLMQRRAYTSVIENQYLQSQPPAALSFDNSKLNLLTHSSRFFRECIIVT
jgi:hypothetical protein